MTTPPTRSAVGATVWLAGVLPLLAGLAAHWLYGETPYIYERMHTAVELIGTAFALVVAMFLVLRARHETVGPHVIWIVAALIAMGLVDGVHSLASFGAAWSWLRHTATLAGGVLFALVWVTPPPVLQRRIRASVIVVAALSAAWSLAVWWFAGWLPAPWVPGGYSTSVKAVNAMGGLGFVAAALFFLRRYVRKPLVEDWVFANYTLVFGSSSLLFGFWTVWAADWWVWHGARLVAYSLVLVSAYASVGALYQRLAAQAKRLEEQVQSRTAELSLRNSQLTSEIAQRTRAEEAIQRERDTLSTLIASITDEIWFVDAQKNVSLVNPAVLEAFGSDSLADPKAAEIAGSAEVYRADGTARPVEEAPPLRALNGERVQSEEEIVRIPATGELRHRQVNAAPVRDAKGEIVGSVSVVRDITDRKRVEELAAQRLARVEALYRNAPVGLCEFDRELRFVRINDRLAEINGVPAAAHLGKTVADIVPTLLATARTVVEQILATGEPVQDVEFSGETALAPGLTRYWNESWYPVHDAGGAIAGFGVVVEETTERRRAERALRESEERFRALVKATSDVVYRMSPDWTEMRHLAGHDFIADTEEPSGTWLQKYIHPDDRPHVMAAIAEAIGTKGVLELEHRVLRVDGSLGWTFSRAIPILDATGEITDWFGMASDITGRKEAEEALRQLNATLERRVAERTAELARTAERVQAERQRLFSVLETLPPMICLLTPDYHIAFANRSFRERFGEASGRHCYESCWGRSQPCEFCETYEVMRTGRPHRWEVSAPDGSVIDVYDFPFTDVDGTPMIAEMDVDITDRRKAEVELAQHRDHLEELVYQRTSELETANVHLRRTTSELVRSNQELQQFAYVASHDLQEPLRAVTGYLGMIEEELAERSGDATRHRIAGAVEGAKRMHGLIADLLALSRVGSQAQGLKAVDLDAVLDRAVAGLAASIEEAQATVTRDPLPRLCVDASEIVQLFQNLIGNAIKFRGQRMPAIHVGAERKPGEWVFSVRDNGIGIDAQYFERIFQVFQRLHTRKKYPGTGIGLAICKKIVERHGGRIWAESRLDQGSTFFFTLPDTEPV